MNRNNRKKLSFDINDFDISFVRGLNFEDGVQHLQILQLVLLVKNFL